MNPKAFSTFQRAKGMLTFSMALLVAGLPLAGWAKPKVKQNARSEQTGLAQPYWPQLGLVQSLDVADWGTASFSPDREGVPPEIAEYARAALQAQSHLQYNSPADAVLKFECADSGCYRVRAQVSQGEGGPVLWEHTAVYKRCPLMRFTFLPDGKKFAHLMVERLTQDYQNAQKPNMAKIEIEAP